MSGGDHPETSANPSSDQLRTELLTLVFTDIVASVALKQQLGDRAGARVIEAHHQLVRDTLKGFAAGQEIETAGDSFLIVFTTPSEAVTFALLLQALLRQLRREQAAAVWDRIGIHLGEVVIRKHREGAKPRDLYGSNVDICARVMSLAKAGQVLMTRGVFDSARQVLKGEDIEGIQQLEWLNHGLYLVQGLDEPIEICEVREMGLAEQSPSPPTSSEKAQRQVRTDEEQVLGWRPAVAQLVPNTQWRLEQKLGEGGFGEVWLGRHQTMKERRVFKFCFRADRVRSLKREMTLFRVLKERVGDHPNIVRLLGVSFDTPPFYVEMDYVDGQDLKNWCTARGGLERLPLEVKLEIAAQVADGLQAAHEAGIIHRDVKPGNILVAHSMARPSETETRVSHQPSPTPRSAPLCAKLTDFGIGQVVSQDYLQGVTQAGFTQTLLGTESSSQTGTQLYMAPELLAGQAASTRSDIYSLGVVLYQLVVNDFRAPMTMDWWKNVTDPLLREDLEHCLAGSPSARYPAAGILAKQLRSLPERRTARERLEAERTARERAAYWRGVVRTGALATVLLLIVSALAFVAWDRSRQAQKSAAQAREEKQRAEQGEQKAQFLFYVAAMNLASQTLEQNNAGRLKALLADTQEFPRRGYEWFYWQRQIHLELRTFYAHQGKLTSVAFSQDNQRVLTASDDHSVIVWDVASGKQLLMILGHKAPVWRAVFSPDGKRIATASWDNTARIWDASTGEELLKFEEHGLRVGSIAFSPDGRRVVTGSWDKTAKVWDSTTGEQQLSLERHSAPVECAVFSPQGDRIVTAGSDRMAYVWDARTGEYLTAFKGHTTGIRCAAFSPDGTKIVTTSQEYQALVWDAKTGEGPLAAKNHSAGVNWAAFSPNNQHIVTVSHDQTAVLWEAANGRLVRTFNGHTASVRSVAFSSDGQWILTGSEDGTAKLWSASVNPSQISLPGHEGPIYSVAYATNGSQLLTGSFDRTVKLWDAATGKQIRTFKGHKAEVTSVSISPNGKRIVSGSADRTAKVWNTATAAELLTLDRHLGAVSAVAFSPDGQRIATAGDDRTVRIWDAESGQESKVILAHNAAVTSLAWSPDGQRIVSGGEDHVAKVWDASTGSLAVTLTGHSGPVSCVAFAPHGRQIATGSADHTARTWDAVSGEGLQVLKGHTARLLSIAFSPDSERVITGGFDWVAKLWETTHGRELLTFRTQGNPVYSTTFSPDGQRIFAGGFTLGRIWESASAEQVRGWQQEEQSALLRLANVKKERENLRRQQRLTQTADGVVRKWLVLAPVPIPIGQRLSAGMAQVQLQNEAELRPEAGEQVTLAQDKLTWRMLETDDDWLDLEAVLGKGFGQCVAYAVAYLHSDADREVQFHIGSDDLSRIYLNGRAVYMTAASTSFAPEQDHVRALPLRAGLNVVVFKIGNEFAEWKGALRITDPEGRSIPGLRISASQHTSREP